MSQNINPLSFKTDTVVLDISFLLQIKGESRRIEKRLDKNAESAVHC